MLAGSLISVSTKQSSWISNRNLFPEIGEPLRQWLYLAKYWGSAFACAPSRFGEDGTAMIAVNTKPCCARRLNPWLQFIPRTADSVSLTASRLEDELKRFPLFAALTINRP
jgi:hypothetical protein